MLPSQWPRWVIVPIGFALTGLTILIGLVLEPAAQALAPPPEPTPTLVELAYAAPQSTECTTCHTTEDLLRESIVDEDDLARVLVRPADVLSVHGRLGCITCHRGTGDTADAQVAHTNLVVDPTLHFLEECTICHADLPDEFPNDRLRTPHSEVSHGLAENVTCSDCHGAVGHGFDPISGEEICSMTACLDCHVERNLDTQLEDCSACHITPHDVGLGLSCSNCHASTQTWRETQLSVHPVELTGWHAEIDCFSCHSWPDFGGLDYVCSDCHNRPHEFGDDGCETCHTPQGWDE
jgi:nitrate/TMAO reductase-like tetraheme cytochrome c subunit